MRVFSAVLTLIVMLSATSGVAQQGPPAGTTNAPNETVWDVEIRNPGGVLKRVTGTAIETESGVILSLNKSETVTGVIQLIGPDLTIEMERHATGFRLVTPALRTGLFVDGKLHDHSQPVGIADLIELRAFKTDLDGTDTIMDGSTFLMEMGPNATRDSLVRFGGELQRALGSEPLPFPTFSTNDIIASMSPLPDATPLAQPGAALTLMLKDFEEGTKTFDWVYQTFAGPSGTQTAPNQNGALMVWTKAPRITSVIVVNNQRARTEDDRILFPRRAERVSGTQERQGADAAKYERELILLGQNLDNLQPEDLIAASDLLVYAPLREFDADAVRAALERYDQNAPLPAAFEAFARNPEEDRQQAKSLTVQILGPRDPGIISFQAGQQTVRWPLQYGTVYGQISTVRPEVSSFLQAGDAGANLRRAASASDTPLGPRATQLYFRDEIQFVVRLDALVREGSFPVSVAANGVTRPDVLSDATVMVHRSMADPFVFYSKSFVLADPAFWHNGAAVAALPEDSERRDWYPDILAEDALLVPEGAALAAHFPEDVDVEQVEPKQGVPVDYADHSISGDFIAALKVAAACDAAGSGALLSRYDWDRLSVEQEDAISTWNIAGPSANISIGQHAALIMVRAPRSVGARRTSNTYGIGHRQFEQFSFKGRNYGCLARPTDTSFYPYPPIFWAKFLTINPRAYAGSDRACSGFGRLCRGAHPSPYARSSCSPRQRIGGFWSGRG